MICGRIKTLWSQWTIALTALWHPRHVFSTLPSWSFPLEEAFRGKRKMWLFLLAIRYFTNLKKLYTSLYQRFRYYAVLPGRAFKLALTRLVSQGKVGRDARRQIWIFPRLLFPDAWVSWRLKSRSGMICWAICINLTFSNQCGPMDFI